MHWSSRAPPLNLVESPSGSNIQYPIPRHATRRLPPFSFDQPDEGKSSTSLQQISTQPQFASSASEKFDDTSLSLSMALSKTQTRFASARQHSTPPGRTPSPPISKKERQNISIRSILREPNTPGTGRSVRFFSKDAYRMISPNMSASASLELEGGHDSEGEEDAGPHGLDAISPEFQQQIEELTRRVSTQSVSGSNSDCKSSTSLSLPDSSNAAPNLFDISLDMPAIPPPDNVTNMMLSDDAIEVSDVEVVSLEESGGSRQSVTTVHSIAFETARSTPSPSLQVRASTPKGQDSSIAKGSNRSSHSVSRIAAPSQPKAQHNPPPSSESSPPTSTNAGWIPRNFLSGVFPSFNRQSRTIVGPKDEMIDSLREQLDIYQKLNTQHSIELGNRDEMVKILTSRVEEAEKELDARFVDEEEQYMLIMKLKKQLMGLERACIRLQAGMAEQSRLGMMSPSPSSSPNRSVTVEASNHTVKALRSRIRSLEQEAIITTDELAMAREEMDILRSQLRSAQASGDEESDKQEIHRLQDEVARLQRINEEQRDIHDSEMAILRKEKEAPVAMAANSSGDDMGNGQARMLREELEAQWDRTEKAMEEIKELKERNRELEAVVQRYQNKSDRSDASENIAQRSRLSESQHKWKEEKDQVLAELEASRQHVDNLMASHSDLQRKLEEAQQEKEFAIENTEQLEQTLETRDHEIEALEDRCQQQFTELEGLRGHLTNADKDYTRQLADRERRIQELQGQLQLSNERSNQMLCDTAERDVYLATLEEKANGRLEENERMRRRVHELEQESATKEMELVELQKDNERFKDDIANLNIALDAKQQELELIKRRLQVKGTGGTTPAPSKIGPRESLTFGMTPRPLGLNRILAETPGTAFKVPRSNSVLPASLTASSKAFRSEAKMGPPAFNKPRESLGSPTALVRSVPEVFTDQSTNTDTVSVPRSTTLGFSNSLATKSSRVDLRNMEDIMEKENHAPLRPSKRPNLMVPS
ncbi:hypothetical protein FRC17_000019 [Serendipita sp. 399]|nr:hypothetical protein FRC17_000019 [Serendipita sp. 399]